jgi:hypothetical protein
MSTNLPTFQRDATPFWKLLFIFESSVLAPPIPNVAQRISFSFLLKQRLAQFRAGNIRELYEQSRPTTETPLPTPSPPNFDDLTYNSTAQQSADQDNLHTAYMRISSSTPNVTLTPHYLNILKKLYPPPIHFHTLSNTHNTRQKTTTDTPRPEISQKHIIKTVRHLKRGTASGPFSTSIDVFKDYALFSVIQDTQTQFPYLETFQTLITHIAHNNIPSAVKPFFSAQYVVALHKDPSNLDKIRPIGIGTALRRITAAVLMSQFNTAFAEILTPHGQLGIAISGGLDFICHSTQAQVSEFMSSPQQSSRTLLSLDITNMFNAISRQACRFQLTKYPSLQPLLPFFDLLYSNPNTCWHKSPTKHFDNFPQWEGFAQGCPLSGAFSDLVLTMVLQPINEELQARHKSRKIDSPPPVTLSYHDDTSIVIPYEDISWFLNRFQELGDPLGIRLNLQKTQILTTLTDESPLEHLPPHLHHSLSQALSMLGPHAEQKRGIRLLGQPIGSSVYAIEFIDKKVNELHDMATRRLFHKLQDHQTQLAITKHCILPSIQHLLATHVYHTFGTNTNQDLHNWNSNTATQLRFTILNIVAKITNTPILPLHATPIIHLPAKIGGLGIRDPIATAVPAALITFTRSIRYAHYGIPCGTTTIKPAQIHRQCFQTSMHRPIIEFFADTLLPALPENQKKPTTIENFIQHTQLNGIQRHLYQQHQKSVKNELPQLLAPEISDLLPSLLSPLTSIPLLSLSRRVESNRIPNVHFRILLQRKLRLPVLPPSLHYKPCICRSKSLLDPYGDHLFSCTGASKIPMHNRLRDTCFHILSKIAPIANLVTTTTDIQLEPPNVLPSHPTLRPADIGIRPTPKIDTNMGDFDPEYIALDITFTATPVLTFPRQLSSDQPEQKTQITKVHDDSARQKFNVPHSFALLSHNVTMLPITFDHLGGIGPFAVNFFYGLSSSNMILPAAPLPIWSPQSFPQNPDAYLLYKRTLSQSPKNVFTSADHFWRQGNQHQRPFGSTYHTATPSSWATQTLSLNLVKGLAQHCHNTIEKIIQHTQTLRSNYKESHLQTAANIFSFPNRCLQTADPTHFPPVASTTTHLFPGLGNPPPAIIP